MSAPAVLAPDTGIMTRYLRPQAGRIAALALFLISGTAMQLVAPLIVRRFIDASATAGAKVSLSHLWLLAALFIGAAIGAQLLQIGSTYYSEQVAWAATNRMRRDLASHALRLDMAFHTARSPGDLIERVDGDVAALANFFSQFILQILGGVLLLAGILIVLFVQDARIGGALTVFAVIAGVALHATRGLARKYWERLRHAWSALSAFFEERIAGLEDIRANAGGGHVMMRLQGLLDEVSDSNIAASRRGIWIYIIASVIFSVGFGVALTLGAWLFLHRSVTIGTVFMFMQYAGMMAGPIMIIGQQLQQLQTAAASLTRIRELLRELPTIPDGPGLGWAGARTRAPRVEFRHLTFAYRADTPVIRDVDLALKPGEVLGLLGRTGSGKTTLSRLLFRLYDPVDGSIALDGEDIRRATLEELRGRIGLVTQEVQLFDATVRDNATLFDPSIGEERVREVLTNLGLGPWLARQENGLGTILKSAGGLSAGEAQLLAFARVFLKDPGLVVLDEASSRLDPATDRLIESALDALLRGENGGRARTAIIIAHKLSTVRRADKIAILDAGRVLEFGDRAALEADPESAFAKLLRSGVEEVLA